MSKGNPTHGPSVTPAQLTGAAAAQPARNGRPGAPFRAPPPTAAPALALDVLLVAASLVIALKLRNLDAMAPLWNYLHAAPEPTFWSNRYSALLVYQSTAIPALLWASGQYAILRHPAGKWSYNRVVLSVVTSFVVLLAMLYILEVTRVPRTVLAMDAVMVLFGTAAWRSAWQRNVRRRHLEGRDLRNIVLVGSGRLQQYLARTFVEDPQLGRRVVGFLADDPDHILDHIPTEWAERHDLHVSRQTLDLSPVVTRSIHDQPRHILAPIATLEPGDVVNALDGLLVEEVYIGPDVPPDAVRSILVVCQERGIGVHLIPEHYPELGIQPQPWAAGPYTLLDIHQRPLSRLAWWAKRGMDVAGGLVGLAIGAPFLLLAAVAIKIEDWKMPVFYRGSRVGLKGRTFGMVKLTTMRRDAQKIELGMQAKNQREGPWFKADSASDPRLTRVGRVLRKFSINEIPQFWNVLRGDMSLVGPRPPIPSEVASYVEYDFRYFRCLDVRPGITGLWQVTCKNDPSFDRRIELDTHYIHHWSVWMDIKIMLLTIWTVVREPEE